MYTIIFLSAFERDVERYERKARNSGRLESALEFLRSGTSLPHSFRDHQLQGKMRDFRELHLEGDWLLVYHKDGKKLIITCLWLVTHRKLRERERKI